MNDLGPRALLQTWLTRQLSEAAQAWFVRQLQSPSGQEARAYLERRGLSAQDVERFGLGFAPDRRRGLVEALTQKGAEIAELEEAGLAIVILCEVVEQLADVDAEFDRLFDARSSDGHGSRVRALEQWPAVEHLWCHLVLGGLGFGICCDADAGAEV